MIRDAGHEIGLHGYSHENPVDMTLEQQRDILDYTYRMLTDFCGGKPPRGTVAPWWEVSKEATELLLSYGIEYDHSMSHHDCQAYYLRTGDDWTKIDYGKKAKEWMSKCVRIFILFLVRLSGVLLYALRSLTSRLVSFCFNLHNIAPASLFIKIC